MNFLGRDKRKSIAKAVPRLRSEERIGPSACAVGFEPALFEHEFEKLVIR